MREADTPGDAGQRARQVNCRRRGDAQFRHLGCNIDLQLQLLAQRCRLQRRTEPAELDQLERHAARAALRVGLDVVQRMDALVGTDGYGRHSRQCLEAGEVRRRKRLLEEQQLGLARGLDIVPCRFAREAAVGVRTQGNLRPEGRPQRVRRGNILVERLGGHLQLEEAKAFAHLGSRLGHILVQRVATEQPHRRNGSGAQRRQ